MNLELASALQKEQCGEPRFSAAFKSERRFARP